MARAEARRFAERMLEACTLAAASRAPVALRVGDDRKTWTQLTHIPGEACGETTPGPYLQFVTEGLVWKIQALQENGQTISGQKLCWHPQKGLLIDSVALENGKLLISLPIFKLGENHHEIINLCRPLLLPITGQGKLFGILGKGCLASSS